MRIIFIVIVTMLLGCSQRQAEQSPPPPSRVSLAFTGDVMIHKSVFRSAYDPLNHTYDFSPMLLPLKNIVDSVDFAVANLETVLAGETIPYSGYPRFNTPDDILEALRTCGFDMLQTVNNHCLDYGIEGLIRTLHKAREHHLVTCGTFTHQDSIRHTIKTINGMRIGFYAFTYGTNGNESSFDARTDRLHLNRLEETYLKPDIVAAARDCDFLFVLPHWGEEYEIVANERQKKLARKMIDWGADMIVGTHPHVVQNAEVIDGAPVVYSLGNCLSSMLEKYTDTTETQSGMILQIELVKQDHVRINDISWIPLWMHGSYDSSDLLYEVVPIDTALRQAHRFSKEEKRKMELSVETIDQRLLPLQKTLLNR